jgi:hypothetical protein
VNAPDEPILEGACRLCNQHARLQLSHIIPAFVFKWTKKDGFIRHAPTINQRVQDGAKEQWLCSACEALFNGWETKFANTIFHSAVSAGLPTISYGEWLLKFCASVSWRSLVYMRQQSRLESMSPEQVRLVDFAQQTWSEFIRGERDHPAEFVQHLVPFGPVRGEMGVKFPPNINRHLLRGVEIDLGRSPSVMFVFSKLGPLAILGFIQLDHPERWVGTKIKLRGGTIRPKRYSLPIEFGEYLAERATRSWNTMEKMSPAQQQKVDATILANIDRLQIQVSAKRWNMTSACLVIRVFRSRISLCSMRATGYNFPMTLADLEKAVATLPPDDLARFRAWFEEFDAARFDGKIERDAKAGKLDRLAGEAIDDHRKGRAREL